MYEKAVVQHGLTLLFKVIKLREAMFYSKCALAGKCDLFVFDSRILIRVSF